MQTAYEILGVERGATDEEIRRAYRTRAQVVHPDRHVDAPEDVREVAGSEFIKLTDAYNQLCDAARRVAYDRSLDGNDSAAAPPTDAEGLVIGAVVAVVSARLGGEPDDGSPGDAIARLIIGEALEQLPGLETVIPAERLNRAAVLAHDTLVAVAETIAQEMLADDDGRGAFEPAAQVAYLVTVDACALVDEVGKPGPPLRRMKSLDEQLAAITGVAAAQTTPTPPCLACGSGPTAPMRFDEVRGRLLWWQKGTLEAALCRDCALSAGRDAQATTLTQGWWGLFSCLATVWFGLMNANGLRKAKRLPPPRPGPTTRGRPLDPGRPVHHRAGPWIATTVVAAILAVALTMSAPPSETTAVSRASSAWRVGACVQGPGAMVEPVSCTSPHQGKIVAQQLNQLSCPSNTDSYVRDAGKAWCIDEDQ